MSSAASTESAKPILGAITGRVPTRVSFFSNFYPANKDSSKFERLRINKCAKYSELMWLPHKTYNFSKQVGLRYSDLGYIVSNGDKDEEGYYERLK